MEPEGKLEEDSYFPPLLEQDPNRQTVLMDFDLDLDTAWPMDQIFALANTSPSFLQSNAEHPYSPLWAFSGNNNDNNNHNDGDDFVNSGGAFRLSDCSRILSSDGNPPDVQPTSAFVNDDKRKIPSSLVSIMHNQDKSFLIKERMSQALRYFKDLSEQHVLAQVWAPVKNGGSYVLTTSGQPFLLDPNSSGLYQYRLVSLRYMFSVDGNTDVLPGLPGRVFQQKLPEWTPNVQYYSSKEFPRLNHALNYNVQGTLALPVFEPSGQSCIGVLELIMTSQKINYAPEVDKVCKALEAVNLKSSEILDLPSTQICTESRQNALAEILEIITVVCETHTLPLAQTWVPCRHRNVLANGVGLKKICSSFDGSCMGQVCMSTTDVAFYVVDAHLWGFREACAEHHLQKGQGVAGRAFFSLNSCFCGDITEFCKTEYPLVHYARMFGLRSSFAICLRSNHTGNDDYVLEFFLPSNIENYRDQHVLLDSILVTMKKHFGGLRVASGKDLDQEWRSVEVISGSTDRKYNSSPVFASTYPIMPVPVPTREIVDLDTVEELNELTGGDVNINSDASAKFHNAVTITEANSVGKKTGRKRGKAEKTISLEVLQQYFAGSLKDAAKSLGVCPTTMKRICRQHGISRWPSRKINKVNRSLCKLQRVIESVQGGEGTFSLKPNSVPITVGSISWAAHTSGTNKKSSPDSIPSEYEEKKELAIDGTDILIPQENGFLPGEGSSRSRTRSVSREESIGTPTSQGSCQGSFKNESDEKKVTCQQAIEIKPPSLPNLIPDHFMTTPSEPLGGLLIEDAGSSHDLRNLCPSGDPMFDEHVTEYSWTIAPHGKTPMPAPADLGPQYASTIHVKNSITIKATYREDIIRFRLTVDSGIFKLREEIAKRLKLEVGTFDIKYFDDDQEWVLIACDTDLQECVDISASTGSSIVRLLVHDIMANLGSSCESSGD